LVSFSSEPNPSHKDDTWKEEEGKKKRGGMERSTWSQSPILSLKKGELCTNSLRFETRARGGGGGKRRGMKKGKKEKGREEEEKKENLNPSPSSHLS